MGNTSYIGIVSKNNHIEHYITHVYTVLSNHGSPPGSIRERYVHLLIHYMVMIPIMLMKRTKTRVKKPNNNIKY